MKLKKELSISLLLAAVPVFFAYASGDVELLTELTKSMMTHKWLMIYSMVGFGLFILVSYLEWRILFHSNALRKFHRFVSEVLYEMASSFLGILRITAGIFISLFMIWLVFDYSQEMLWSFTMILVFGVVALVEACWIRATLEYAQRTWLIKNSNQ
ncbi:hypothetical protein [Marinobacter sp. ANT_B65]|uniref:hypothetical protein n=1 Tax=Marinobacter sp. ANT_B65 TaxID=2039467 RepID=UPI000BBED918|nr:hypothetical protein [Marinobacter sp. ANT_B65]PCM44889.1 hypothetical protein CPA50_02355 [Marinobacter sp. ANT_B65]